MLGGMLGYVDQVNLSSVRQAFMVKLDIFKHSINVWYSHLIVSMI